MINDKSSILFISSRRTFGIKLLSDLKKFGFELYSEIKEQYITKKRVICQIDSLMRLERDKYDFLIVDECESLARYLTSSHFIKNPKANLIVSSLEMRISDANNVYIMDADLSDRCLNYYCKIIGSNIIDNMSLVINKFKPYESYTIKYMNFNTWLNIVLKDIEDNKKLVIPIASNNKAKDLLTKIKNDFPEKKVLLIHKETSDEEKINKLIRVNEEWTQYDVVIYTPSVCMGVSFDVVGYFDNIYAYGCINSLGSQEFCQMLHRVRNPKNNVIYLSLDNYKEYDAENDTISKETVERMLCSDYYLTANDLHNNLLPKKIVKIVHNLDDGLEDENHKVCTYRDKIIEYPYKNEPIYDLYVRNSWEMIENNINFSSKFFEYVKNKGYNLEYLSADCSNNLNITNEMKQIRDERVSEETAENIDGIFDAPNISKEEYINKIKQRDEYISDEDKSAIKRYNMINCYNLDKKGIKKDIDETILTKEFIEKYSDKEIMRWFRNYSTIINSPNQNTALKLEIMNENKQDVSLISNCYLDFTSKNRYGYHYYAIEIINSLGFDINDLTKTRDVLDLDSSLIGCIEWCEDKKYDIIKKYEIINYINKNLTSLDNMKARLKFVNSIINTQYGLKIKKLNNKSEYIMSDEGIWDNLYNKEIFVNNHNIESNNIISRKDQKIKFKEFNSNDLDMFLEFD